MVILYKVLGEILLKVPELAKCGLLAGDGQSAYLYGEAGILKMDLLTGEYTVFLQFGSDIIFAPIITEKTAMMEAERKYAFKVDVRANKTQIKQAIEEIFKVKVESVNTLNNQVPGN